MPTMYTCVYLCLKYIPVFTYAYNEYLCLPTPTMYTFVYLCLKCVPVFTYAYFIPIFTYAYMQCILYAWYYILTYNSLVFTYGMLILHTPDI